MNDFIETLQVGKIYFESNMEYWYLLNFILGMCFASCVGLIVARWPKKNEYAMKESFVSYWEENGFDKENKEYLEAKKFLEKKPDGFWYPNSRCDSCGNQLKLWHNIPIIGWLSLKGRCAFCHQKIPVSVLGAEIIGGLLGVLVAWLIGEVSLYTFLWLVIVGYIAAASWLDWNTLYLPTESLFCFTGLILIASYFSLEGSFILPTSESLLGVIVGFSILLVINKLIYGITSLMSLMSKGGREPIKQGFGEGDYYLLAALGALLGYEKILVTAVVAIFVGVFVSVIVGIYNHFTNKEYSDSNKIDLSENKIVNINGKAALPFGPSISIAAMITVVLYKLEIIQYYL